MCNNLVTRLNTYPRKQACKDFGVSYTVFKRVISGFWQKGGTYYKMQEQEQEEGDDKVTKGKHKDLDPVDMALAKKRKVTLSANMAECKYCGKLYCSSKKFTDHINSELTGEQKIFACLYCSTPFNQYADYLEHLRKHKDKVIRCRLCNKEFKTIKKLRITLNPMLTNVHSVLLTSLLLRVCRTM